LFHSQKRKGGDRTLRTTQNWRQQKQQTSAGEYLSEGSKRYLQLYEYRDNYIAHNFWIEIVQTLDKGVSSVHVSSAFVLTSYQIKHNLKTVC